MQIIEHPEFWYQQVVFTPENSEFLLSSPISEWTIPQWIKCSHTNFFHSFVLQLKNRKLDKKLDTSDKEVIIVSPNSTPEGNISQQFLEQSSSTIKV